jgi:hypothetical protein
MPSQIYNGRKTDQCGVIVFGSEGISWSGYPSCSMLISYIETKNIVNSANGGYDNVLEYIPIAQPNANTIAKLDALEPSTVSGDRMANLFHVLKIVNDLVIQQLMLSLSALRLRPSILLLRKAGLARLSSSRMLRALLR